MTTNHVTLVTVTCQVDLLVTRTRIGCVSELPSWYPGTENKPAPMPLLRLQAFINTLDVEDGTDLLILPAVARDWLVDAGLLPADAAEPTESDLELARSVRESIRAVLADPGDGWAEPLRQVAAAHCARLTVSPDGAVELENARDEDVGDALFELLLIMHRAQRDGTWSRLRVCGNPDCQWAFYDRSRNHQGNWCDMAVCGNRLKNRELRARRR
jgi:CGNR zinc finger/Putative stress-induced transcription regulator